jgi:quercetin dioxygenase-like cupin family protein
MRIQNFKSEIDYADNGIVSKQIVKHPGGNVTLFAFDKGQELATHTSPFDALVNCLEGAIQIQLDGQPFTLTSGDYMLMPANIPHAVAASERFKMLLTMIRPKN